ncbi:MAG: MATE family efflux transporter [Deltaproteobacteria bacterium]|nr:MATE family efflux transporter [Deltaproteobacteria bacterium]MBT6432207.1 MATE family efflux transporter [Deltaproteobacteria bacterium]MBT6491122.1 MATE family efflux transporter [Deltaproteobacteria bacterium]
MSTPDVSHSTFQSCSRDLLKLAVPIVLIQISLHMAGFVDTVLIGKVGELELGATGLGSSLFFFTSLFGMGIVIGLDPVASQAFGAERPREARVALWQGFYLGLAISVPLCFVYIGLGYALELAGVVPEVAEKAREYVIARSPSIIPIVLITAARSYLQAAHVTRPIIEASIIANVVNFIADWVLIYGDEGLLSLGLPAMGIEPQGVFGVGVASTVTAVIQTWIMLRAVQKIPVPPGEGSVRALRKDLLKKIWVLGLPIGLHMLAEVGFFALVQVLMGGLGSLATASHQAALTLASLTFSACLGVGMATSVQVGRGVGENDPDKVRYSSYAGILFGVGFMTITATVMWIFPRELIALITPEPQVIEMGASLLVVAGFFQIVDAIQAITAGALRGVARTRETFVVNLVGHWAVGLPVGCTLCYVLGFGPEGLWWGLTTGLAVVAVVLSFFVWRMVHTPLKSV